jgi:hypothetical protein
MLLVLTVFLNPLNGSNTINVSQDGNNNINFKLQESWLNGLNTSFQSSLNIASNTYQTISGFNSFRTTVSQTYQTICRFQLAFKIKLIQL